MDSKIESMPLYRGEFFSIGGQSFAFWLRGECCRWVNDDGTFQETAAYEQWIIEITPVLQVDFHFLVNSPQAYPKENDRAVVGC